MIDAQALVVAHHAVNGGGKQKGAEAASDEPAPRQFPLAGQSQPRPLADPARRNTGSQ